MDVHWRPTEELTIQAGIAYLDSKVTEAPNTEQL